MSNPRRKIRLRSAARIRSLVAFSAAIMLVFCGIVLYQNERAYHQSLARGEENAARLTRTLTGHAELTFLSVDLALRRAIEREYINSLFGNNLPAYMEQNFRVWLGETPQIAALALLSADGKVEVAAHKPGYGQWREYTRGLIGGTLFNHMRETDDRYVFVGLHKYRAEKPAAGAQEKDQALIILSRRYNQVNGEFGGIVVAAIDPNYFVQFYTATASGKYPYMSLSLSDGSPLSSGPARRGASDFLAGALARESAGKLRVGEVQTKRLPFSAGGGDFVIAGTTRLQNLPVTVTTLLSDEDALAEWRQARAKDVGFLALFVVFGSVLSFFAVAMARQITRAEESEEAAILASQAKSDFLANMSHELRTPLNAIIGFSEMMSSGYFGTLTPKQRERIQDINLCGTHLLQLITDILEFSKGEAGKLELAEETVRMEEIIGECERIMSGRIKTRQLSLVTAVEPEMPPIWGDKRKIRQILLNLLANAVKFTPEGGGIKITCLPDTQGAVNLIVSDTGIGIAEEDIPRALSVFGQVTRSQNQEGTGLGLPLCKMYAEMHGGKLILTSKPGEGTTVRIIFPRERTLPRSNDKLERIRL